MRPHFDEKTPNPASSSLSSSSPSTRSNKRTRVDHQGNHTIPHGKDLCATLTFAHLPDEMQDRKEQRGVQDYHRRTLAQLATALANAKTNHRTLEADITSNDEDFLAASLEVRKLMHEHNTRQKMEYLQYDRRTTTESCVVYGGKPNLLQGLPFAPVLTLYAPTEVFLSKE